MIVGAGEAAGAWPEGLGRIGDVWAGRSRGVSVGDRVQGGGPEFAQDVVAAPGEFAGDRQ